ncbi:MAG: aerotolerance regulator BatA [Candidatus Margulisiibacteriota bacterium]|nr:MAG: aerotolerance regulator BatA [Candidatus Margulisbacteria bacterium GWD2_39_127]OGI05304.1 MAG: aerotolerance regulator BatA [Candidatus Margulisbacteria bacterium GWF2_38_17]OGI10837.1 MAG: aerotolerance regulator BatA [Candidatus Margulisbacteria bacterium GWE2_39_32]PZM83523.1 MAG: aerotolerance regulator BatA [Candidatus Margulisiibacteriota bacterium]HAR64300.1 aerotolerance regulator BatA [Candidatus Margulisiibacteriota bacterium]
MIRFGSVYYLALLVFLPLIYWWLKTFYTKRSSYFLYSDINLLKNYTISLKAKVYKALPSIHLFVLFLIIIALSRPQYGTRTIDVITHGVDIISAIDVSGTMAAEDFKPKNRIETAKELFKEFVRGRKNDRIGLIVFAGKSYTQVPLTLDYAILETFLNNVKIGMIEDGTAIGMAIATSINRLRKSDSKSKVIILLTDGDNNAGEIDPITAAKLARSFNIKIYAIGVGKEGGAPIPFSHPLYGKVYYQNPDGSLVMTKIDEESLKQIASITGGRYFRATDSNKLREIYKKIDSLEKTEMKIKEYDNFGELANYFLVPAMLIFLLEIILSLTWLRRVP